MTSLGDIVVAECAAISHACSGRDAAAFDAVTNCPPWTLTELLVHIRQTLQLPPQFVPGEGPVASAADWYRRAERETVEYRSRNVDRARNAAARVTDGAAAARELLDTGAALAQRYQDLDGAAIIRHPAVGAISIDGFFVTRVISVAVHGVDVAISLDIPIFVTPGALVVTTRVVEELAGCTASEIGLSDLELVLAATGRRDPPEPLPGPLADRLPLIS